MHASGTIFVSSYRSGYETPFPSNTEIQVTGPIRSGEPSYVYSSEVVETSEVVGGLEPSPGVAWVSSYSRADAY